MLTNGAQPVSQVSTLLIMNGERQKCYRPTAINTVSYKQIRCITLNTKNQALADISLLPHYLWPYVKPYEVCLNAAKHLNRCNKYNLFNSLITLKVFWIETFEENNAQGLSKIRTIKIQMYRQIGFKSVLVHCSRPTKSTS
jgi:hypothetical protein